MTMTMTMTMTTWRSVAASFVLAAAALGAVYACVPADTRPVPTELNVSVSPSPAVMNGVVTADGWAITFNRVLLNIGGAGLSDDCTEYSSANYDRVLDITHDAGQKLSQLHALGQCDFRFRINSPSEDSVLGIGVTEEDKARMRTAAPDPYPLTPLLPDGGPLLVDGAAPVVPRTGIALDLALTATRADVTKTLHLIYRSRLRYQRCSAIIGGATGVYLTEGDVQAIDLRFEAEALLRDDDDAGASLRFNPFAEADTDNDNDGNVTLDELRKVPLAKVRDGGAFEAGTYDVDDAGLFFQGRNVAVETLGDFVYVVLIPLMPRFREVGRCASSPRGRRF